MRGTLALLIGLVVAAGASAQAPGAPKASKRYGIEADLEDYPQATPKEALRSVLKAIEGNRINYLLAQLADPPWVDQQVKQVQGDRFDELVQETADKLAHDRSSVKELRRFLSDGTWEEAGDTASAQLKDVKSHRVYLRKLGGRWFLENRQQASAAGREK